MKVQCKRCEAVIRDETAGDLNGITVVRRTSDGHYVPCPDCEGKGLIEVKECYCGNPIIGGGGVCDACRYEGNEGTRQRGWRTRKPVDEQRPQVNLVPPFGMMTVPHWEWWLHHNPFKRSYGEGGRSSCPICQSDTGCFTGCPGREIENKMAEIKHLMQDWRNRQDIKEKSAVLEALEAELKHWDELADRPDSDQATRAHRNGLKIAMSYIKG